MKTFFWSFGWCLAGIAGGWAITWYNLGDTEFNKGVAQERTRCTAEAKAEVKKAEIDQQAELVCKERLYKAESRYREEREQLRSQLAASSSKLAISQTHGEEAEIRSYFTAIFDRLRVVVSHAEELQRIEKIDPEAVKRLNEDARSVLIGMGQGREEFKKLQVLLNSVAETTLAELRQRDMEPSEIRNRLGALADSQKEREVLVNRALNNLRVR